MAFQILQYEFLGPVPFSEWGPPMADIVYLVLSRRDDRFDVIYAGECGHTDDRAYLVQHPEFACWSRHGAESSLYLAVLPVTGGAPARARVVDRLVSHCRPPCNPAPEAPPPPYRVRGS
ncbi:MAG: hypothetical protein MPI95_05315 [Nitrosopumilus sp.]|nr:hypothetical protein [Nitrosopumilus sp.]CAI9831164.1 conserved hypothetical protein [Nitrosopumilaceae archaeon]MDA7941587.1 hypothetical protein [Nitrosopumilus sp.]MDA7943847.1 hypothetical protein [Nitrosopumilus sp.]MDA7945225.1 hypothetical protein [Nitrosopumilus sp.]